MSQKSPPKPKQTKQPAFTTLSEEDRKNVVGGLADDFVMF